MSFCVLWVRVREVLCACVVFLIFYCIVGSKTATKHVFLCLISTFQGFCTNVESNNNHNNSTKKGRLAQKLLLFALNQINVSRFRAVSCAVFVFHIKIPLKQPQMTKGRIFQAKSLFLLLPCPCCRASRANCETQQQ